LQCDLPGGYFIPQFSINDSCPLRRRCPPISVFTFMSFLRGGFRCPEAKIPPVFRLPMFIQPCCRRIWLPLTIECGLLVTVPSPPLLSSPLSELRVVNSLLTFQRRASHFDVVLFAIFPTLPTEVLITPPLVLPFFAFSQSFCPFPGVFL